MCDRLIQAFQICAFLSIAFPVFMNTSDMSLGWAKSTHSVLGKTAANSKSSPQPGVSLSFYQHAM